MYGLVKLSPGVLVGSGNLGTLDSHIIEWYSILCGHHNVEDYGTRL